jgi:predicted methyltransferase
LAPQDQKACYDFSRLLAAAAGVRSDHAVLDLFLGLGYSAQEALSRKAKTVVSFEVLSLTLRSCLPVTTYSSAVPCMRETHWYIEVS